MTVLFESDQNLETKKYSLGPEIDSLAQAYRNSFRFTVIEIARLYLDDLRLALDQTVVLELPFGDRAMVVYVTEGLGPIRISARLGDRRYYHSSAGGKCILAFSSDEFIKVVLNRDLPELTLNTVTEPKEIINELEKIRRDGFSSDDEENSEGISAFAVPLLTNSGLPIAAITVAGPSNVLTWDKGAFFIEQLKKTAESIHAQLTGKE